MPGGATVAQPIWLPVLLARGIIQKESLFLVLTADGNRDPEIPLLKFLQWRDSIITKLDRLIDAMDKF